MMGMAMGRMGVRDPCWYVVGSLGNGRIVFQWFHSVIKIEKVGLPVKNFLPLRTVGPRPFALYPGFRLPIIRRFRLSMSTPIFSGGDKMPSIRKPLPPAPSDRAISFQP